jgi:WD40 repeat protein
MAAIFISHNSKDAKDAAALKRWLADNGWDDVFLDIDAKDGLSPGERWKDALRTAADRCEAVLCLVSPTWLASAECKLEFRYAEQLRKHIFLAIIKPCDPKDLPPDWQWCPLYGEGALTTIAFEFREQPAECSFLSDGLQRLKNGLEKAGISAEHFPWPPASEPDRAPYRGLKPLEAADAAVFFGRNAQILYGMETLWEMQRTSTERLLVILGASGSGKSSFMRAGLVPRLTRDDRQFFPLPVIRPRNAVLFGAEGLAPALAAAFAGLGRNLTLGEIEKWLNVGPEAVEALLTKLEQGLLERIGREADQPPPSLVFPIDQAEELFNPDGAAEAAPFLNLLGALLSDRDPLAASASVCRRALVLLTIRSDRYERLQTAPGLAEAKPRLFDLRPFPPGQFERVINGPAERATAAGRRLKIEPRLTERLLTDFAEGADTLPLLGFALEKLYHKYGSDGDLTLEDYEAIRGSHETVQAAIFQEAIDSALAEPYRPPVIPAERSEQYQGLRRAFIPYLARINPESNEPMRQVAKLADLPADVHPLVERLVEARLLIRDKDAIEVAHESLLRQWPSLHGWLTEDRDKLRLLENIRQSAAEWKKENQRDDLLVHRDGRLKDAEALLATPGYVVAADSDERAYLNACTAAQQARETAIKEEQERRIRDAERIAEEQKKAAAAQEQKARRTRIGLVVVALMLGLAIWQWWETQNANKKVGEVQQLARHTSDIGMKPQRSLLLSVRAASLKADGETAGTLNAIDGVRQQLRTIGGRPLMGHEQATRVAAFSLDRRWLATGSDDGAIRLWDLNAIDPTSRSFSLDGHKGPVHGLAFSPDGRWLVSGGEDGAVRLWRLTAEGASLGPVFGGGRFGAIHSVAISPKGDWLAFGTHSGNVCIWKMSAEGLVESPCEVGKEEGPVKKVQFSAKGRWLATARADFGAKVSLWDLSADFPNREPERLLHATTLPEDFLLAIAFNGDDTRLAVAYGYAAEVWDVTQKNPPRHVVASATHTQWITDVGLSPDNRWLATGSIDTDVTLWDLTGARKKPIVLKDHSATVTSVAFSDDGRWLATGADDATARLWDMANPRMPAMLLRGQDRAVKKVIFSPGSETRHLVTVGDEPHARLWNIPDPLADPIVLRGQVKPGIAGMAISADGKWIATSSAEDEKLVLWSSDDPRQPVRELPLPSYSHAIAFSKDGRWLAAKSQDKGVISLWNFADLSKPPLGLREKGWGDVRTLRFSPDSRWLVSGTWGGILNIWDVSSNSLSLEPRHHCNQREPVREPAFSADGRYVATAVHGFSARLWDLTSQDPCASSRVLPHVDVVYQVAFSPDSRWIATASIDGKGRLWDLRAGSEPKLIFELPFKDRVVQAAFSRDNRWVAFGSWDATLKLKELKNPGTSIPIELFGHAGRILAASFSPDSQWLASAGEDRTIRLWNMMHPNAAPIVLRGHDAPIAHIGFSDDSRWIVTGAADGTVRRWRLKLDDLVTIACQTAGRGLTSDEAKEFLGTPDAPKPCADHTAAGRPKSTTALIAPPAP